MNKIKKYAVSVGGVLGALLLGVLSAQAALTIGAVIISTNGGFSIDGLATSTYAIGTSTTSGTITIGGEAQTGLLTVGQSSDTNTVGIGTGAGATTINVATGAGANVVNVASGGTAAKTVNIGTGQIGGNVVTIGNTSSTSALKLRAGTGRITLNGQLVATGTTPTATEGGGAASVVGSDTAGLITSVATVHSSSTITFAASYTLAPICVFSAADAATGEATSTYATVSATNLAIFHSGITAAYTWNYFCIKTQ